MFVVQLLWRDAAIDVWNAAAFARRLRASRRTRGADRDGEEKGRRIASSVEEAVEPVPEHVWNWFDRSSRD
jgi:hypothetical protein